MIALREQLVRATVIIGLWAFGCIVAETADAQVTITGLGPLSCPWAVNNSGSVVGSLQQVLVAPDGHASTYDVPVQWTGGAMEYLGTLGSGEGGAHGINSSGDIVGWGYSSPGHSRAVLYSGGSIHDLGTFGGEGAWAPSINDSGQIAGSVDVLGVSHAFLYSGGSMQSLGTLGGSSSAATSINNSGQVVGVADVNSLTSHAFLYSAGLMQDLGSLVAGGKSYARTINNVGQTVGWTDSSVSARHAFIYTGGSMLDLGTLWGGPDGWSEAWGINNRGQVVGASDGVAVLWSNGKIYDLNHLISWEAGWTQLNQAVGINDAGEIVGWGYRNGVKEGFLMTVSELPTVVPEPVNVATLTACAIGLFALLFRGFNWLNR